MKKHRYCAIVLALVLLFSIMPIQAFATTNPFSDVEEGKYYYDAVMWAVENGITEGTSSTTFSPNKTCSRGQVVTFLWRAKGCPLPSTTVCPFSDIKSTAFYYTAVLWAVENGVTSGTSATTFSPNNNCTRGQVVTFLWRAQGCPAPSSDDNPFSDVDSDKFYYDAVLWAVENEVTAGTSETSFSPNATCTRGQIVTFLYRAIGSENDFNPLVITSQLHDATINEGETVELSISVRGGEAPYQYQWQRNGASIPGANSPTYTVEGAGSYTCTVVDARGNSITSTEAIITVRAYEPLTIAQQPQNATIDAGDTVVLNVSVSGGVTPYQYQWMTGGVDIVGATASSYTASAAGNYSCRITDSRNNVVLSSVATVTVIVPDGGDLTITSQPVGGEIPKGSAISLAVGVDGGVKPYSYQWYLNSSPISGATYRSYVATQAGTYFCAIYDSTGDSVISNVAIVTIESIKYDIVYDLYRGDDYLIRVGVDNPNPDYYTSEEGLVLRNLAVDGYVFEGWYDGPGANAQQVRVIPKGQSGVQYLYAHWSLIEYTVQFKSSLFLEESRKTYTVDKGVVLPTPKLSNYVFTGWQDENGMFFAGKTIPVGTTGNIILTANWTSERNKTWTKPSLDEPIIHIDEDNNTVLFVYEIGEIQNVPLYVIKDFGYIAGDGVTKTERTTYSFTTSETLMQAYAKSVSQATTESSNWTLSNTWNEVTSVDEQWCQENGKTVSDAETIAKSSTGNWNISNGTSGSTDTTTLTTNQDGWENQVKINASHETGDTTTDNKAWHIDPKISYTPKSYSLGIGIEEQGSINTSESGGWGFELGGGYEHKWGHEHSETDKSGIEIAGTMNHTGIQSDSTVTNSSWNSTASYGGSNTSSATMSNSTAISQMISEKYGYGQSYATGGTSGNSQGLTASQSSGESYSSSVTYSTVKTAEVEREWTTQATKPGYHRWIVAGTAHVFAVVGYDMASQAYFVYTYSVMDDETHEFEDYSYTTASYNDEENGVISFEVPYEVAEYITELTSFSSGLKINQTTGVITSYNGTDSCVVIPEYMNVGNGDVVKVTGISSGAFRGNTDIQAVVLSDNITEIPAYSFEGCTSLVGVSGGSITSIGERAFSGCSSVEEVGLRNSVVNLGEHAFDGVDCIIVNAANADVVCSTVQSGARKIILCLDYLNGGENTVNGKSLHIPQNTVFFELNGNNKTYQNLSILSEASITVINKTKIMSNGHIPIQINSPEVVLNQSSISSTGIGLVFEAECTHVGLQDIITVTSSGPNALLSKSLDLYEANENVEGKLVIKDKLLLCGSVEGSELLSYTTCETITETQFDKYLHSYKLYFDANGGTCPEAFREIANGTPVGELPIPTRQYYTFDGWYLSDGTLVTSNTVFSSGLDITVYAHWTLNSFIVTFDPNGGSVSPTTLRGYCGQPLGTLPTPTRTGCTFDGWYTAKSGGTQVTAQTVYTTAQNITVYAHWSPIPYKVTYTSNGTGYSITVRRTSSPVAGAGTGNLSSGAIVYYNDVLSVTYTASTGYSISSHGSTSITVTGNVTSSSIYATASANSYTYNIVYKSVNGTALGTNTATYQFGTSHTITPPAKSGYATPAAQTVQWDSTTPKTITFSYTPNSVSSSQAAASGTWYQSPDYSNVWVRYSTAVEYRNRTSSSVEIRVVWTQSIQNGYFGFNQYFSSNLGGQSTGNVLIASSSQWPRSGGNQTGSVTAYSGWVTVPVSATATSIAISTSWWSGDGSSGSWSYTMAIPTY